ncbi:MAG: hypothetical protein EOP87_06810 [Verrucomicrobiaceae bacterium]|nr:MAG: hypothetical protein EOP87_06810 [Verrucomicrobiaceae bacterium]
MAIIMILIALGRMVMMGAPGVPLGLYLGVGAAPLAWWMGAVLALLAKIARNGESAAEGRSKENPARAELEKMLGGGKAAGRRSDDDLSNPPNYNL